MTTLKDKLVDIIIDHLHCTYHCTRVWSAWSYGTMGEDDFEEVNESDTPDHLADAIIGLQSRENAAAATIIRDVVHGNDWNNQYPHETIEAAKQWLKDNT